MLELTPPFVVCDGGDLATFSRLEDAESQIEVYDTGRSEFFDATGRRLIATADGYRVHLHADAGATPEPDRLEALLRTYFAGLGARHERFAGYARAAERATSLEELVDLRVKLSEEPRYDFASWIRRKLSTSDLRRT